MLRTVLLALTLFPVLALAHGNEILLLIPAFGVVVLVCVALAALTAYASPLRLTPWNAAKILVLDIGLGIGTLFLALKNVQANQLLINPMAVAIIYLMAATVLGFLFLSRRGARSLKNLISAFLFGLFPIVGWMVIKALF